jgi:hypothetical protein
MKKAKRKPNRSQRKYTVLLLYPDYLSDSYGQETFLSHVRAKNVRDAIAQAQSEVMRVNDWDSNVVEDKSHFYPLSVFEGHLKDLACHS